MGIRRLAARTAHSRRETGKSTGMEKGRRSHARIKRPTRRKGTTQRAARMAATNGSVRNTKRRSQGGNFAKVHSGIMRDSGSRLAHTASLEASLGDTTSISATSRTCSIYLAAACETTDTTWASSRCHPPPASNERFVRANNWGAFPPESQDTSTGRLLRSDPGTSWPRRKYAP